MKYVASSVELSCFCNAFISAESTERCPRAEKAALNRLSQVAVVVLSRMKTEAQLANADRARRIIHPVLLSSSYNRGWHIS